MSNNTEVIEVTTNTGDVLPLRQLTARNGNTYWGITNRKADGTRYYNKYGVNVSSEVISELPKAVSVGGVTIPLKLDVTEKGQRRVRGSGKVTIDGYGEKVLQVRFTEMGPSTYNIDGCIRGASSSGPRILSKNDL
jgi:hypothetical protein